MKFENVSILGVAHEDPPHRVTSNEIGLRLQPTLKKFGLSPEFLGSLTGIQARRLWGPDVSFSQAAALAAEKVLSQTGLDRRRLGVLISTSVSKEYLEPSMACLVHGLLKLEPDCVNFDVGNACLAFVNAMEIIGNMVERGQVDFGIIVDGEGSRYTLERTIERLLAPECTVETLRDNLATLTLGSGGAAMILARSDLAPEGRRVTGSVSLAATEHSGLCRGGLDGMTTDAAALLTAGVELARQTWRKAGAELGWTAENLDHLIIHQVSRANTVKLCQTLGLDEGKMFLTFPEYGNVGPAAVPLTLSKALEAGRVNPGDRVALMGIGSGLNCTMMEVIW